MGTKTGIEWCDHTWNPWRGCVEVSDGCANCYAREMSKRNHAVLGTWGPVGQGSRPWASLAYMETPHRWNTDAIRDGVRRRVFCGSLMDIFEDHPDVRTRRQWALRIARQCHHLDWLLLTKRPANIEPFLDAADMLPPPNNFWLGTTVENQARAEERIPVLCSVPAKVRFLSLEPLLEEVDLTPHLKKGGIHWVIVGGESRQGSGCRPFDMAWAESIVTQCGMYKVPVFVKQMGDNVMADESPLKLIARAGKDQEEWPDWLRRREFPTVS